MSGLISAVYDEVDRQTPRERRNAKLRGEQARLVEIKAGVGFIVDLYQLEFGIGPWRSINREGQVRYERRQDYNEQWRADHAEELKAYDALDWRLQKSRRVHRRWYARNRKAFNAKRRATRDTNRVCVVCSVAFSCSEKPNAKTCSAACGKERKRSLFRKRANSDESRESG